MAGHSEFSDMSRRGLLGGLLNPVTDIVKGTVDGVSKTVGGVVNGVVDTVDKVVTVVDNVVDKVVPIPTQPIKLPPVTVPPVQIPSPQPTPAPPVNQQPPPVQQPPPENPPSGGDSPPPTTQPDPPPQQAPPVDQNPPPATQQPPPPPPPPPAGNEQQPPPANTPPPSAGTPTGQPTSTGNDATETPLPPKQSSPISGAGINIAANAPSNGNAPLDPDAPGTGSNPAGVPTRLQQDAGANPGQSSGSPTNSGANGTPGTGVDGKSGNGIITPGGNGNGHGTGSGAGNGSPAGIDAGASGAGGPNIGAIVGGVVGALLALLIIFALLFRYRHSRRLRGLTGFFNRRAMRKHKRSSTPNGMMGASLLEKGNMYEDVDREMWCPSPPPYEDGKRLSTDNGAAPQHPKPARHKPLPVQYNTFAAITSTTTPAMTGAVAPATQQPSSMAEKRTSDSSLQAAILAVNGYKPDGSFKHPATQHPTTIATKKPPALHPTSSTIGLSFGGPATPALPSPARSRPSNDGGRDARGSHSGWSDYFRYQQNERPASVETVSGVSIASSSCMSPSMMSWQPSGQGTGAPPTAHSSLFTQSRPPTSSNQ